MNTTRKMLIRRPGMELLLLAALTVTPLCVGADEPVSPWWNTGWHRRVEAIVSDPAADLVRIPWPKGASPDSVRCVLDGTATPLSHWTETVSLTTPVRVAESPTVHFGFPRMVRAANGHLLLFYRVGVRHAADRSTIALQRSTDDGKTWSDRRTLWQDEEGYSAHNPVALVARDGRVILWISRFQYAPTIKRLSTLWTYSDDHGETWAPCTRFDDSSERNSYYITDAIATEDGLLAGSATFPPTGANPCYVLMWHSADDGRTWTVRSSLTQPAENLGDEVGLLETTPGTVLCLLRDRRQKDIYRMWSKDAGKTWTERERLGRQFGCVLQRPVITRFDAQTLLVTGRDRARLQLVAYVSRDNGQTFGERHVLETYRADGAYPTVVTQGARQGILAWYTDEGTERGKPDIKVATLTISDQPRWLWVRLPAERTAAARLRIYFDNAEAKPAEDRVAAEVNPLRWTTGKPGLVEMLP